MQFTLATILSLASIALSIPTSYGLEFTPGLQGSRSIPPKCRAPPSWKSNHCPAFLRTGNTLVTARNIGLDELTGSIKTENNVLRVGWRFEDVHGRVFEESTLAIFDFPSGQERRQCKFQFITDGFLDGGDASNIPASYFNVWSLKGLEPVGERSTWYNKPARDTVLATFTTDPKRESYKTRNGKHVHGFVFGPGEKSSGIDVRGPTFPCPSGGVRAYEVASAIKTNGRSNIPGGDFININGNAGLGIEILGLRSSF
ncbi:hypothetical protein K440DRAFT_678476 [Wilcoxina mikolae CBS 423.85]|nr:hypothetical protein K440DRAFT_678476 [Wilcoxina mikolae CBS 423.85]